MSLIIFGLPGLFNSYSLELLLERGLGRLRFGEATSLLTLVYNGFREARICRTT
jgi:hypothetical protein